MTQAERQLVLPLLRLLLTLSTQGGEVVRSQAVDVVKSHQPFFSSILLTATHTHAAHQLEEAELTTALLARVGAGDGGWGMGARQGSRRFLGLGCGLWNLGLGF